MSAFARFGAAIFWLLLWRAWRAAAEVEYAGTECVGIVDFPLNDSTNFTEVDSIVRALLTNREIYPVWLTKKCHAGNRKRVCMMTYDDFSSTAQKTCKDSCDEAASNCNSFFKHVKEATGTDAAALVAAQCSTLPTESCLQGGTETTEHDDDKIECPYPLVVPDDSSNGHFVKKVVGSGCAIPCPSMLIPDDERTLSNTISLVLLVLGSLGSSITAFAYHRRESGSTKLVVWTALVSFFCSVVTLAYVAADFNSEITCVGNSGYNVRGAFCVAQAAVFMFCFLEFQYLNLFSIFQLWAGMMLTVPKSTIETLRTWYTPVSTAIIAASVASMYSQDALGFEWAVPRPFCFYIRHTDGQLNDGPSSVLFWVFIYGPTAFATTMTLCLTVHALRKVNRVLKQSAQIQSRPVSSDRVGRRLSISNIGALKKRLVYNKRTFKFLVVFVVSSLVYLPLMYYLLEVKEVDYQDSMLDVVRCLLTESKEGGETAEHAHHVCGTNPTDRPDIWIYQYICFYLSAFGICVFLVYGSGGKISGFLSQFATQFTSSRSQSRVISTDLQASSGRISPRANKSPPRPRAQPRHRSPPNSSDDFFGRDSAL